MGMDTMYGWGLRWRYRLGVFIDAQRIDLLTFGPIVKAHAAQENAQLVERTRRVIARSCGRWQGRSSAFLRDQARGASSPLIAPCPSMLHRPRLGRSRASSPFRYARRAQTWSLVPLAIPCNLSRDAGGRGKCEDGSRQRSPAWRRQ